MKFIYTIFLSFLLTNAFAQCKDSVLIKPWGKWNELQYNSTIYRLEHHTSDSMLASNIRSVVKNALINRCGTAFYSKLKIYDLSIVIPLKEKQHSDDLVAEGLTRKGEIKYYYSYLFYEKPNIEYRFNIALDVQGKILTEWQVPVIKENEYVKIISFCEATTIAYNDRKAEIKKINEVVLMYDPKLNYFAWKITVGHKTQKEEGHYKTNRITINAFTGTIIDRWDVDLKKYDSPGNK